MDNEHKLNEVFLKLFSYSFLEDVKDISFFEEPINMKARQYIALFLEVEKEFKIRFPDKLIEEMKMITYDSLLREINCLTGQYFVL